MYISGINGIPLEIKLICANLNLFTCSAMHLRPNTKPGPKTNEATQGVPPKPPHWPNPHAPSYLPILNFDNHQTSSLVSLPLAKPPKHSTMFCTRCIRTAATRQRLPLIRQFSASAQIRSAEPKLSTPLADAGAPAKESSIPRSICPEGTVLTGLNYNKGGQDPVAKKDEEYPEWLWSCLDVMKTADAADENAGDEFCTSNYIAYHAIEIMN